MMRQTPRSHSQHKSSSTLRTTSSLAKARALVPSPSPPPCRSSHIDQRRHHKPLHSYRLALLHVRCMYFLRLLALLHDPLLLLPLYYSPASPMLCRRAYTTASAHTVSRHDCVARRRVMSHSPCASLLVVPHRSCIMYTCGIVPLTSTVAMS
jgi:hypothetical protein